jgi:hypothetical protein
MILQRRERSDARIPQEDHHYGPPSPGFADAARLYLPIFVWIEHKIGVEIARVARNFRCGPGRHSKFLGITGKLDLGNY